MSRVLDKASHGKIIQIMVTTAILKNKKLKTKMVRPCLLFQGKIKEGFTRWIVDLNCPTQRSWPFVIFRKTLIITVISHPKAQKHISNIEAMLGKGVPRYCKDTMWMEEEYGLERASPLLLQ